MGRPIYCGIYRLVNMMNGKCYVGQSVDVLGRFSEHFSALRHQRHINKPLQNAFNKYGESAFNTEILLLCDREELNDREKDLIRKLNSVVPNGYNLTDGGDGNCGWKPPQSMIEKSKKKVILLNKLRVFSSMDDAAAVIGISPSNISCCCNGKTSYAGKCDGEPMVWDFLSTYDSVEHKETYVQNRISIATKNMNRDDLTVNRRRTVCLNNRMVFESASEANMWCGGKTPINIIEVMNGRRKRAYKSDTGEWYTWADYDKFLCMSDAEIQAKIKDANTPFRYRTTPVKCLTTGQTFQSTTIAAKEMQISQSSITLCCQHKLQYAGKHLVTRQPLRWEYISN